ncbi:MAG: alpha/beta hydrolase [Chloroflexota bacterium]
MTHTYIDPKFLHRIITIDGASLHIVEAGQHHPDSVVFLHGWPQDWTEWQCVMEHASATHHVIAFDLPGIGGSSAVVGGEKTAMAKVIHQAIEVLALGMYTLVGHDAGAMTAYAYLRNFSSELQAVVLMSSVIPGIEPWSKVLTNPYIWHFAFHNIPKLPEALVAHNQHLYFDYFFDTLTKDHAVIDNIARDHYAAVYATPEALQAGFDWYRAFAQDAEINSKDTSAIDTSLLYLRGEFEGGDMDEYVDGFHQAGIQSVTAARIFGSGHYTPEENPEQVWTEIVRFINAK